MSAFSTLLLDAQVARLCLQDSRSTLLEAVT